MGAAIIRLAAFPKSNSNHFQARGASMSKELFCFMLVAFLVFITALITGCNSIPIPEGKETYIGTWEGVGFHLTITDDGAVNCRRVDGKSTKTITGPVTDFRGDDFVVSAPFVTTRFEVQLPPYMEGDDWFMVVDGIELKKIAGPIYLSDHN
jgi:hypothetical protein